MIEVVELERRAFFTPRTLAKYLSLSDRTVREMLRTGKIASYKVEGARRINPSGKAVWVARVTRPDGRREAYKPAWNGGKGTFATRGEAQRAIDEYYNELYGRLTQTVGAYFARGPKKHPRAARTQATNAH